MIPHVPRQDASFGKPCQLRLLAAGPWCRQAVPTSPPGVAVRERPERLHRPVWQCRNINVRLCHRYCNLPMALKVGCSGSQPPDHGENLKASSIVGDRSRASSIVGEGLRCRRGGGLLTSSLRDLVSLPDQLEESPLFEAAAACRQRLFEVGSGLRSLSSLRPPSFSSLAGAST